MVTTTFIATAADRQEGNVDYTDFLYRQLLRVIHSFVKCGHPNRITIGLRRVPSLKRVNVLDPS
jgi:septum formation topological specificity factor MinE